MGSTPRSEGPGLMRHRYSFGTLVVALALILGAMAGAASGGLTAFWLTSEADPTRTTTSTDSPPATVRQGTAPTPTAVSQAPPVSTSDVPSIADLVERVSPAVGAEQTAVRGLFGSDGEIQPAGTGTGFIVTTRVGS